MTDARQMAAAPGQLVVVVDDDPANVTSLRKILERERFEVEATTDPRAALRRLTQPGVAVLLTDLMMPEVDGLELLRAAARLSPDTTVVMMTAYGTVETAVSAMKEGAYDFITKPLRRAEVVRAVTRAHERAALSSENRGLRAELDRANRNRAIIGNSMVMRRAVELLETVAPARSTVLLLGESGTGKEVFARALHLASPRRLRPFVALNCAAIPENLIESELFGHERGAFTGAVARRDGKFQLADGGTLLLDEIGDLPLGLQGKLLRALQEGEIERVGGDRPQRVDVRVVAATNRDLRQDVAAGRFREDLYWRLDVIRIELPPLRARSEDVPALAQHFLRRFSAANSRDIAGFDADALDALMAYRWPGNVRELENVTERAVVLCKSERIGRVDLPAHIGQQVAPQRAITFAVGTSLDEMERIAIDATLRMTGGDKRQAAALLGIAVRTIYRKLEGIGDNETPMDSAAAPEDDLEYSEESP
jgi:two-component system, NtrC family, response regulator HydG